MIRYPYGRYEAVNLLARELRNNQTLSEKTFWELVRRKKILGKKFLRQFVLEYSTETDSNSRFCIVDFYCPEAKLVVEIDGDIHEKQKEYDSERSFALESLGITVLRINNNALHDIDKVVKLLYNYLERTPFN
jgi:very-short-patch-repair endonuclease